MIDIGQRFPNSRDRLSEAFHAIVARERITRRHPVMKKIEQRGGKICVPRMGIPKVGWLAYAEDPAGNIIGIIEPDTNAE